MPVERETIITDGDGSSGGGSGLLLSVVIVVLVLVLLGGITIFNGGFSLGGKSVTVDVPKVTVTK